MSDVFDDIIDRQASPGDAARIAAVVASDFRFAYFGTAARAAVAARPEAGGWHPDEPAPHGERAQHQARAVAGVLRPSHRARRRDGGAVRRWQASRDTGVKKPARRRISGTGKSLKYSIKCSGLSRELSGQNSSSGASRAPRRSPLVAGRLRYRCFEFVVLTSRVPVPAGKNAERVYHYPSAGITDQRRSQAVDNLRK